MLRTCMPSAISIGSKIITGPSANIMVARKRLVAMGPRGHPTAPVETTRKGLNQVVSAGSFSRGQGRLKRMYLGYTWFWVVEPLPKLVSQGRSDKSWWASVREMVTLAKAQFMCGRNRRRLRKGRNPSWSLSSGQTRARAGAQAGAGMGRCRAGGAEGSLCRRGHTGQGVATELRRERCAYEGSVARRVVAGFVHVGAAGARLPPPSQLQRLVERLRLAMLNSRTSISAAAATKQEKPG
jgi:hypothetical protein